MAEARWYSAEYLSWLSLIKWSMVTEPMVCAAVFLHKGKSQVFYPHPTSLEKWNWLWGLGGFLRRYLRRVGKREIHSFENSIKGSEVMVFLTSCSKSVPATHCPEVFIFPSSMITLRSYSPCPLALTGELHFVLSQWIWFREQTCSTRVEVMCAFLSELLSSSPPVFGILRWLCSKIPIASLKDTQQFPQPNGETIALPSFLLSFLIPTFFLILPHSFLSFSFFLFFSLPLPFLLPSPSFLFFLSHSLFSSLSIW